MNPIHLICTDLDGTLLGDPESLTGLRHFGRLLDDCRRRWGTRWAVVTGRRKIDADPVLLHFLVYGIRPDLLVVEDGLIYRRGRRGIMMPFWWWNFQVMRKRFHLGRRSAGDIRQWRDDLLRQFPEGVDRSRQTVDLWLEFPDSEQTLRAELALLDKIRHTEDFQVYRWDRELFLAPSVGTKGEAVRRICAQLKLQPPGVFAIGDGPNDLSMLDGSAAGMPSCVGNALEQVKAAVRRADGFIARGHKTAGVTEALEWYIASQQPINSMKE